MVETDFQPSIEISQRMGSSPNSESGVQSADAPECFEEVGHIGVARCDAQRGRATGPHQLRWDQEQPLAQALQGSPLQMRWGTEPLEPIQEVVGQQHDLEERFVAGESFVGILAKA